MINIKQNFEDQYFDNFGFPMIICHSHPNNVYEFINLNKQNPSKLACAQCIIKDRLNPEFLISIKDIFSQNPNNIIQNWPPLQDHGIYQQLISHSLQESKKSESIEQINKYFDKFKVDILKVIDDHQKKILVHINSIEENRQRVMGVYNEISSKEEIKNEFLKNKNNQQQLEQNLKQIISMKQTQEADNLQNINNALDRFTKCEKQFEQEYIQNVFEQILMNIKQIEVLNPLLNQEQQFSVKIQDKKRDKDEEIKIIQNMKIEKKEEKQNKNEIKEIDLLESLQIIKSNYGQPDKISFKKIENKNILIERSGFVGWSQVIIDSELIGENKYQIQIELKRICNKDIFLGLLPISQKDQAGERSKLSLCLYKSGYGIDWIESGKHICELNNIKQISIQICLKENILRCLSVANKVKNINSLDDWNKIKPNQKYYFYIEILGEQQLHIKYFKIMQQFEQW